MIISFVICAVVGLANAPGTCFSCSVFIPLIICSCVPQVFNSQLIIFVFQKLIALAVKCETHAL